MPRELLIGLLVVGLLAVGIGILFGGGGGKLGPREQAYINEMKQLRAFYDDKPTQPHLPDHLYVLLEDSTGMFLHFDKPVGQDSKILYIGPIVLGRFCKADQERVEQAYGPGFTHFHQKFIPGNDPNAGHGGKGGEDGFWFRHIAVGEFDMPWGRVEPGIDFNFMPTPAPEC